VEIIGGYAALGKDVFDHVCDHANCVFEDLSAFHAQMPDRAGGRWAAVDVELLLVAAVSAQAGRQDTAVADAALALLQLQHDRASAVAEQHTGGTVLPVEDAREGFGADDQRATMVAGAH